MGKFLSWTVRMYVTWCLVIMGWFTAKHLWLPLIAVWITGGWFGILYVMIVLRKGLKSLFGSR